MQVLAWWRRQELAASGRAYNCCMRRGLAILALCGFLAVPLWAQRRGSLARSAPHLTSHLGAPAGSNGFRGPSNRSFRSGSFGSTSAFRTSPNRHLPDRHWTSSSLRRGSFRRGSFRFRSNSFFPRRFGRRNYWPYYSTYYPYNYFPYFYDGNSYQSEYHGPASYQLDNTAEVEQLRDEVAELRQRQEDDARYAGPPRADRSEAMPVPATLLVFKDKHTQEVQNYAIVGPTLWIFSDQTSKRIPLAQLDVPRTSQMNEERGVDFAVPQ